MQYIIYIIGITVGLLAIFISIQFALIVAITGIFLIFGAGIIRDIRHGDRISLLFILPKQSKREYSRWEKQMFNIGIAISVAHVFHYY